MADMNYILVRHLWSYYPLTIIAYECWGLTKKMTNKLHCRAICGKDMGILSHLHNMTIVHRLVGKWNMPQIFAVLFTISINQYMKCLQANQFVCVDDAVFILVRKFLSQYVILWKTYVKIGWKYIVVTAKL